MLYGAIALALIAAACAFIYWRRQRPEPSGWTAGPVIDGKNVGAPIVVDASGSFAFPTAEPGVHYVTKACASLASAKGVRLRYRIDAAAGTKFVGCKDGIQVTNGPFLYLQRKGDDWSGTGKFETFRWWASFAPGDMTPGEHEIVASFADSWTAVETSSASSAPDAFKAALANAARIGFTFPNNEGLGHGLYATGAARFTVLAFEVA